MKMCSSHYTDLRRALQRKGMGGLIQDIGTIRGRADRWLKGRVIPSDGFDPLMVSTLELYKKAAENVGAHLHGQKANGEHYCPLCEVGRVHGNDTAGAWIDNCTDAVLIVCETNGLRLS